MSACSVWHQPGKAYLMTDGAQYELDGKIRALRSKVTILKGSRVAVAKRGAVGPFEDWLLDRFSRHQSFDDLLPYLDHHTLMVHRDAVRTSTDVEGGPHHFEVTIAGWSEIR